MQDTLLGTAQRWRDTCFGLLNKTATWIPSGYLLDYSLADSTFKGFNPNDTITESGNIFALLNIFNLCAVNSNKKTSHLNRYFVYRCLPLPAEQRQNPIAFFIYQLRANPLFGIKRRIVYPDKRQRKAERRGRQTSPYNTKTCFTFAPLQDSIVQFNAINFALPAEFRMMSGITAASIDFGDGSRFRTLSQGSTVNVNYSTEGRKYLTAKITTAKGDVYAKP